MRFCLKVRASNGSYVIIKINNQFECIHIELLMNYLRWISNEVCNRHHYGAQNAWGWRGTKQRAASWDGRYLKRRYLSKGPRVQSMTLFIRLLFCPNFTSQIIRENQWCLRKQPTRLNNSLYLSCYWRLKELTEPEEVRDVHPGRSLRSTWPSCTCRKINLETQHQNSLSDYSLPTILNCKKKKTE